MDPSLWQQIEKLYHAALECDPGERAALLARADPDLRREVESLLARGSGAASLDHPAWEDAASLLGSTVAMLTPGTQLGPYKIEGPLGSGGMGEVFRAVDTRLGRAVAIKTSQEKFSARFDREARAISSLNHPHICTLHDVGPNYLVMELCEGETLAARLKRGKLSIRETLRYGAQIADALAAAHAKGITHRDLKPGNIMLGKSGIKVLDFGLAKSSQDLTLTGTHMVMGTPAYMAPEQREGKECDARTDIYAVGLILHEMATGKRAEQGQVLQFDQLPERLTHVIERCLEQEPDDRWQSARDVQRELEWAAISGTDAPPAAAVGPITKKRSLVPWILAALLLVAFSVLAFVHFREHLPQGRSLRFQIPLPEKEVLYVNQRISPDGRYLAFSDYLAGGPLWVRPLNSSAAQRLVGTEGAEYPFWSPDSESIGFFADGKLKRIEVSGGPALTLADAASGRGGTWSSSDKGDRDNDGVILFTPTRNSPILRISARGGAVSPVTKLRTGEFSHRLPWFLPDGRHFFYSATHDALSNRNTIHLDDLSSQEDRVIGEADSEAVYSQGFLLFMRQEILMAQPFDARRGVAIGDAVPLEQQIDVRGKTSYGDFSASTDGLLAFRNLSAGSLQLTWVDRKGRQLGLLGEPGSISELQFSPDRKRVATTRAGGTPANTDVWIYDAASGLRTRFTFDPAVDFGPVWSPNGRSIIFASLRKQHYDLYRKSSDGAGAEELLYSDNLDKAPTSWSPDGKFLLYEARAFMGAKAKAELWVLPLTPERQGAPLKPFPFAQVTFSEGTAQFSPDGRWIAYISDESQRGEVYVARFPGGAGKRQISIAGGDLPRWRRDGKEIFYIGPDEMLMSAAVTVKGDALEVGEVKPLFGPVATLGANFVYDVSDDGQRFLILPPPQGSTEGVTVVQNWLEELQRRMAAGK